MKTTKPTKPWWEGIPQKELPEYIKLNGCVYQIDDAISLGKITAGCLPATRKEYLEYKNRGKKWLRNSPK